VDAPRGGEPFGRREGTSVASILAFGPAHTATRVRMLRRLVWVGLVGWGVGGGGFTGPSAEKQPVRHLAHVLEGMSVRGGNPVDTVVQGAANGHPGRVAAGDRALPVRSDGPRKDRARVIHFRRGGFCPVPRLSQRTKVPGPPA